MTSFQKIIKYGAIGFGLYLCFVIISMIIFGFTAIFGITTGMGIFNEDKEKIVTTKWEQEYSNIDCIDINLSVCKLIVQKGETLKVEASEVTEKFICKTEGNKLKIEDENLNRNFWGVPENTPEVILYLPENINLEEIIIETGINETKIDYLKANKVKIEMGVGEYQIDNLIAEYAKIEAGAGKAVINDSDITELKLDGGVGELVLTSKITDKADVSCGMGRVEINLIGLPTDYQIKTQTGLGEFKVDGQKIANNQVIGTGTSEIKIDAGVGETIVNFVEDKI